MDKTYLWKTFKVQDVVDITQLESIPNGEASVSVVREQFKKLLLELRCKVLVEDMTNRRISQNKTLHIEYQVPKSTWQFFKKQHEEKWWMSWFVQRFKIKTYTEIVFKDVSCFHSFNPMLLFPEYIVVPKNFGRAVRYVDIENGGFRVYNQAADYRQTRS